MHEINVVPMKCELVSDGLLHIDRIGAGVGIIVYNSGKKLAVGVHVLRGRAPEGQQVNPVYYADTVVPYIMQQFQTKGALPPYSVAVVGAAALMNMPGKADSGSKLLKIVKEALEKAHLTPKIEETGGAKIRSIMLNIDAGKIKVD